MNAVDLIESFSELKEMKNIDRVTRCILKMFLDRHSKENMEQMNMWMLL